MKMMIVKSMDMSIDLDGVITCIIGPTNSGKTHFLKKLCNKIDNSDILLDMNSIKNYDINFLKKNIVVALDDNHFYTDTVKEELSYCLKELKFSATEIKNRIDYFAKYFKVQNLLKEKIDSLTLDKRMLIKILSFLIIKPKIFGVDNLIAYLSIQDQNTLFKYIREEKINLLSVTTNMEDLLRTDKVIVLNAGKAIYSGTGETLVTGNSIIPYMGMKMPFIADLSQNLILYGLIDHVYLERRKLVEKLWK